MDDPVTPLLNQWNYASLLHEIFEIKDNKIKYINPETKKEEEFVLSSKEDNFYRDNMFKFYVDLTTNTTILTKKYTEEINKINAHIKNNTINDIRQAIDSLRELKKLQNNINKHINLQMILSTYTEDMMKQSIEEHNLIMSNSLFKKNIIIDRIEMKLLYFLKYNKFYDDSLGNNIQTKLISLRAGRIFEFREKQLDNIYEVDKYEPLLWRLLNKFKKQYGTIIIYVEGGMTYAEAQIAYEFGKNNKIDIIIGSTKMLSRKNFVEELLQI